MADVNSTTQTTTGSTMTQKRGSFLSKLSRKGKIFVGLGFAVFLVAIGSSIYFYNQYQNLKNPNRNADKELKALVAEVGKLMVLPEGETPTLATVTDPAKLKSQAFFANAEQGDKVLVYAQARKAILYSPKKHKIIEVAPVNLGAAGTGAAQ